MISIENIQYIEWALIIGFILGIVTIVVGYMDMKKKSKKIMKEGFQIIDFPEAHTSFLLDSIYNRRTPEIISYDEQAQKVPKSHVQSYKQYTNNRQSKYCGSLILNRIWCPRMEKSPIKINRK